MLRRGAGRQPPSRPPVSRLICRAPGCSVASAGLRARTDIRDGVRPGQQNLFVWDLLKPSDFSTGRETGGEGDDETLLID
jgi:hypothetical protein